MSDTNAVGVSFRHAETQVKNIDRAPLPHTSLAKRRIPRLNSKSHRQASQLSLDENQNEADPQDAPVGSKLSRDSDDQEFDDSDDTDLEIEELTHNAKTVYDPTGRRAYESVCKKHHMVSSTRFSRQLCLEKVNMSKACLGPKEVDAMAFAISANTNITELNLSDNCIGPEGARVLADALKENVFVKTLGLSDNALGTEGARAICELFRDSCQLREVDLSGNGFRETDAEFFVEALTENYTLQKLSLRHNEFREKGGEILAQAISQSDSLQELDLSWNHLRLKGGRAIGNALKHNQTIKILNVSWNGLSNDGAYYFAMSLKENSALKQLDLTCNRITIEGTAFLFSALKVNETLRVLKLGMNPVTSAGVTKILDAVKKNPLSALVHLELADTPITYEVGAIIAELQDGRPSFDVTHGGYISSDDAYAKRYAQKYEINPFFLLMSHVRAQGFRLIDMFIQFDVNRDWSITRDEFVKGLQMAKIPLTQGQLDKLVTQLDKDNSGTIDLSEFIKGEREFRMKQRKQMRANKIMHSINFTNQLSAPVAEQPGNVRSGTLPDIKHRGARPFTGSPRPHSGRVASASSTTSSRRMYSPRNRPVSSAPRKRETPTKEMAGNFLDLVITTDEENHTRIEGRPRSAASGRKSPVGRVPDCNRGFAFTPPPDEWTPPQSPTPREAGNAMFSVVVNALSTKQNGGGATNIPNAVR